MPTKTCNDTHLHHFRCQHFLIFAILRILLSRVLHGPHLADNIHFDLARIFEFRLYAISDLARQLKSAEIIYFFGHHEYPEFPACRNGIGGLHARETRRDLFKVAEPFDVVLYRAAPGSRPRRGQDIRRRDHIGLRPRVWIILVMRLHRPNHLFALIIFPEDLDAKLDVRSLDLMVDGFADVVEQAPRFATSASRPSSRAIISARYATSMEWVSTFCPKLVRK